MCPGPRLTCSLVCPAPNRARPNAGAKVTECDQIRQTPNRA